MTGFGLAMGVCYGHKGRFSFNPDTVVVVMIDPVTGFPPDVAPDGSNIIPTEEARARAVTRPLCDRCVQRVNRGRAAQGRPIVDTAETTRLWTP